MPQKEYHINLVIREDVMDNVWSNACLIAGTGETFKDELTKMLMPEFRESVQTVATEYEERTRS